LFLYIFKSLQYSYSLINLKTRQLDLSNKLNYRAEIDGLRSVAVIPVILFHAGFETFSGGFVGVDIFFVISGYLITSIILAEMDKDKFSLAKFYERRARRILPALFAVMAASIPFAWMWMLPQDLKDFAQSLMAVPVFASNFLFLSESGYFDTQTDLKPLLHTWSLAVEEQYYLLFPLFLMLCWNYGKRRIVITLVFVTIASLLLAHWGAYNKPSATFYLLPMRIWEILLGSLCAFYLASSVRITAPRSLSEIGGLAGLICILVSIFVFAEHTPFPSFYALLPTLGTVLIILFATEGTLVFKVLGNKVLVGLGLISYSAYLWHQPLFAFAKYRALSAPSPVTMAVLCAFVLPLAYLSWRFIEKPFRTKTTGKRKQIFALSAAVSVLFIAIGITGDRNRGFENRDQIRDLALDIETISDAYCHAGGKKTLDQLSKGEFCIEGGETISVALIGDSHAGALARELGKALKKDGIGAWMMSSGWCAPFSGFRMIRHGKDCDRRQSISLEKIIAEKSIKTVILYAEWANYTKGFRDKDTPSLMTYKGLESELLSENPELFSRAFTDTIKSLKAANKNIIIVEPTPEFDVHVLDTIRKAKLFKTELKAPSIKLETYYTRNTEVLESFKLVEGVTFISTTPLFCNDSICSSVTDDGTPLVADTNHLTEFGARLIADKIVHKIFK